MKLLRTLSPQRQRFVICEPVGLGVIRSGMEQNERKALAAERAHQYAPKPTGGAVMAGICGAVVVLLTDVSVSRFYSWRLLEHAWLTALGMVVGFAIALAGYLRARRLNRRAHRDELRQINVDEDAS